MCFSSLGAIRHFLRQRSWVIKLHQYFSAQQYNTYCQLKIFFSRMTHVLYCRKMAKFFLIEQAQLKKNQTQKPNKKTKKTPQTHLYGITVVTLPIHQTVDTETQLCFPLGNNFPPCPMQPNPLIFSIYVTCEFLKFYLRLSNLKSNPTLIHVGSHPKLVMCPKCVTTGVFPPIIIVKL